jgi:hypothetical protein
MPAGRRVGWLGPSGPTGPAGGWSLVSGAPPPCDGSGWAGKVRASGPRVDGRSGGNRMRRPVDAKKASQQEVRQQKFRGPSEPGLTSSRPGTGRCPRCDQFPISHSCLSRIPPPIQRIQGGAAAMRILRLPSRSTAAFAGEGEPASNGAALPVQPWIWVDDPTRVAAQVRQGWKEILHGS